MTSHKKFLRTLLAAAALCAVQSFVRADIIVWDPDGGGNSPVLNISAYDFTAGNTLFRGALPFGVGNNFQLLFHGQLSSVVSGTGTPLNPVGLNASGAVGSVAPYEITVVGSVTETVTSASAGPPAQATFQVANTQALNSFVEVYFDGNQNANPLQGTGYNDGLLILQGVPFPQPADVGDFSLTNPQPSPAPNFDNFGNDDYSGVTSVTGSGSTKLEMLVTYVDASFFVAPGVTDTGRQVQIGDIVTLNLSQGAPFSQIDPSQHFALDPNPGVTNGPSPTATPAIGSDNGTSGPDLQAQATMTGSIGSASPTATPSATPTPTPSPTPSATPTPTPTNSPTANPGNGKVSVKASRARVREGGDVVITFTYKGLPDHPDIMVNYTVGGNATPDGDYVLSGVFGHVLIPAGANSASITMHAILDQLKEPHGEAARISVTGGTQYAVPAQKDANRVSILIVSK